MASTGQFSDASWQAAFSSSFSGCLYTKALEPSSVILKLSGAVSTHVWQAMQLEST